MWTDEELTQLEEEEHSLTEEAIAIMLLRLSELHSDLEKELRTFYQMYGTDGIATYSQVKKWVSAKDHRKRYLVLYATMIARFDHALVDLETALNDLLNGVIEKETEFFDCELEKALVLKWGIDNLDAFERLLNDVELWKARIQIDWKRSFLQRKHIDKVLEDLDDRFNSIYKALDTLVQSESTAVGSIARKQILKKLGYTKYRFYSRPDERRCETCGAMHGLIFPLSAYNVGETASPLHPRCRCWEVPIE